MAALEHEWESLHELELESVLEGEGEAGLEGEGILGALGSALGGLFGEGEGEGEGEFEVSPVRKIYADAMMEHLAHMAAEAETEQEAAEHFLPLIGMAAGKLLPLVAKAAAPALRRALPRVAKAVTQVAPRLTQGISTIARGLHRTPATRRLLHAVPTIARRTVSSVARQAAQGRPVTPQTAVRTLSQQARQVLGQRPQRLQALRRSQAMDQRFHRHMGPGVVRPHQPMGHPVRPGIAAYPGHVAPGVHPGHVSAGANGWASTGGVGRTGTCSCPPCPTSGVGQMTAAPAYCRCCGQVLR